MPDDERRLLPTTVVGSYPQPEWLVDREKLRTRLPPRVRVKEVWRVQEPYLEEAQDDATIVATVGLSPGDSVLRLFERASRGSDAASVSL